MMQRGDESDGLPLPQRYGAILAIALGITMAVLDGAIANVALPTIARDMQASPASSIWVVNAYQLAITISSATAASTGRGSSCSRWRRSPARWRRRCRG